MTKAICKIYNNRQEICKKFPGTAKQIQEFPNCTYFFEGRKRKGYCCGCGECCVFMVFNGKRYPICPYVKKIK